MSGGWRSNWASNRGASPALWSAGNKKRQRRSETESFKTICTSVGLGLSQEEHASVVQEELEGTLDAVEEAIDDHFIDIVHVGPPFWGHRVAFE